MPHRKGHHITCGKWASEGCECTCGKPSVASVGSSAHSTFEMKISEHRKKQYRAYVDGGCTKNGSHLAEAYGSYRVYDVTGLSPVPGHDEVTTLSHCLEEMRFPVHQKSGRVTNNIAEATAMFLLISSLHSLGYFTRGHVEVFCDSLLIVNQLRCTYATKDPNLLKIHRQTYSIFEQIRTRLGVDLADALTLTKISGDDMKRVLGH